jgi:hypothetical protein
MVVDSMDPAHFDVEAASTRISRNSAVAGFIDHIPILLKLSGFSRLYDLFEVKGVRSISLVLCHRFQQLARNSRFLLRSLACAAETLRPCAMRRAVAMVVRHYD